MCTMASAQRRLPPTAIWDQPSQWRMVQAEVASDAALGVQPISQGEMCQQRLCQPIVVWVVYAFGLLHCIIVIDHRLRMLQAAFSNALAAGRSAAGCTLMPALD
jgi:hypothetical protein